MCEYCKELENTLRKRLTDLFESVDRMSEKKENQTPSSFEFNIYSDGGEKESAEKPKKINLKLEKHLNGDIMVVCVNEDGDEIIGNRLVVFLEDGTLKINRNVNPIFRLPLDEEGRMKVIKE